MITARTGRLIKLGNPSNPKVNIENPDIGSNAWTIRSYTHGLPEYLANTPDTFNEGHAPMLEWMDSALTLIPPDGKVLEIGSGTGRDARYIRQAGYSVQCTDAAISFVNHLRGLGEDAFLFNALSDEIPRGYHMIFANSVMPHFTPEELRIVLGKICDSLEPGGIACFSIKQGEGEEWIKEKSMEIKRYVRYWSAEQITDLISDLGYDIAYFEKDIPGDLPNHIWMLIVARKNAN